LEAQIGRNVEAYIDDIVVKSERPSTIFISTRWCLILKNMCLVYHQENYSATWYHPEGSMQPEEGGGHQTIVATPDHERNAEEDRHDGSSQLVYI
jgi:hypothetical protein